MEEKVEQKEEISYKEKQKGNKYSITWYPSGCVRQGQGIKTQDGQVYACREDGSYARVGSPKLGKKNKKLTKKAKNKGA